MSVLQLTPSSGNMALLRLIMNLITSLLQDITNILLSMLTYRSCVIQNHTSYRESNENVHYVYDLHLYDHRLYFTFISFCL